MALMRFSRRLSPVARWAVPLGLALLALALRLYRLGDVPAPSLVECEALLYVRALAAGHAPPYANHVWFRLTPVASFLFYLIELPFAALGGFTIASLRAVSGVAGAATVLLTGWAYRLLYPEDRPRGEWIAMAVPALLVGMVTFGRLADQMPLIPFFSALDLVLYLLWRRRRRPGLFLGFAFATGLGMSVHLIMTLTPLALLLLGRYLPGEAPPALSRGQRWGANALVFLGLVPLLVANLRSHGMTLFYLAFGLWRHGYLVHPVRLGRGLLGRLVGGFRFLDGSLPLWHFVGWVPTPAPPLMSLALLAAAGMLLRDRGERSRAGVLLGWMGCALVGMSFSPSEYHLTHFLLLVVPGALLLGRMAARARLGMALAAAALASQIYLVGAGYFAAYAATGGIPRVVGEMDAGLYYMSGLDEVAAWLRARPGLRTVYVQNTMLYYPLRLYLPEALPVVIVPLDLKNLPRRGPTVAFVLWAVPPGSDVQPHLMPAGFNRRRLPGCGTRVYTTMEQANDHARHWVQVELPRLFRARGESLQPALVVRGRDGTPHLAVY